MNQTLLITVLLLIPLAGLATPECPANDSVLVRDGRSDYVIYHNAAAPASVKEAARELQRVLKIATGVQLPIAHASSEFMIVLGDTPETRQAGIDPTKLAAESFEIKDDKASRPADVAHRPLGRRRLVRVREMLGIR